MLKLVKNELKVVYIKPVLEQGVKIAVAFPFSDAFPMMLVVQKMDL